MTQILIVVGILTLLGALTLAVITIFFYWGDMDRKQPLSREERRALREEELKRRGINE